MKDIGFPTAWKLLTEAMVCLMSSKNWC